MLSWSLIFLILAIVVWLTCTAPERPKWLLRGFLLALVVIFVITAFLG
jgi:hypothetical protein